jgi:ribosomal protein S1
MDSSVNQSNEVKVKAHYTGKVVKTSLAGALVNIGADAPAYLHVSQIVSADPTQPIKRVEDVIQVDQEVEVWVKRIREGRVELTMMKPLDLDWKDIKPEMVVKGKVVKLEKFGAFVEIGAERPGLIHISEMAHGYVRQPGDVVKEGDEVEAQVLDVNRKKKQIKLSLKALQEAPVKEEMTMVPEERSEGKTQDTRRRKPAKSSNRRRGDERSEGSYTEYMETPSEPEPTAMEILLREAMEKAKGKKPNSDDRPKKGKKSSKDFEEIFSRTLEQKQKS